MEVIKLLVGMGEPLTGQMLVGDLRDMSFRRVQLRRNPDCTVCGAIH
jgi:adenylyltransferase/sulfurtransferase